VKILLIHNLYQQAGGEDAVMRAESGMLTQAGHSVKLWLRDNATIQPTSVLEKLELGVNTVWSRASKRELKTVLVKERPDVVHFHNTFPQVSPAAYYACKELGIPVVQSLHNYRLACPAATFFRNGNVCQECTTRTVWNALRHGCYRSSRSATAAVCSMLAFHRMLGTWSSMVDRYIALSAFARETFVSAGLPPEKLAIKPNFVVDPGSGGRERDDYGVFVGRLSEEKGLFTILRAWRRVGARCRLRIAGDGPLRGAIESMIRSEALSGISLEGRLPSAQVLALMKRARFLLFPSECFENFPLTIVEAFACGTPVLASRIGSVREIVQQGHTGIHVNPGDPTDWAEKILDACEGADDLRRLGHNARTEYERKYTPDTNHRLLMQIYGDAARTAGIRYAIPQAKERLIVITDRTSEILSD
jgi:glycosyltransferase involved in cell wall biosynthesis